jgi:phosphoglycerate dehydrogenase-like enzyme
LDPEAKNTIEILQPKFPQINMHAAHKESEVGDFIEKADIILAVFLSNALIQRAKNLKWIQSLISGVDKILCLESLRPEVLLTSSRGIHGPQVSELALMFMLALSRDFPQNLKNQMAKIWTPKPSTLLYQKKVAILGMGAIGGAIAQKCKAFDMTVFAISRSQAPHEFVDFVHGPKELAEVISRVDYFINVLPSTPQTQKIVNAKVLAAMKPTAYYISIGRGDTVDEEALVDLLEKEKIAGAAMDVFATEPLPEDSPLWDMKNVIITPHSGGMCDIYYDQVLPIFEKNLDRYLVGDTQEMINIIDRS